MDTAQFDLAIATALRGKRGEKSLTLQAIADLAGIPVTTMERYFKGTRPIPASKLVAVSDAMNVPVGEIIESAKNILARSEQQQGI